MSFIHRNKTDVQSLDDIYSIGTFIQVQDLGNRLRLVVGTQKNQNC